MNKNFAKHLSGVLEGMSYNKAVKVIEGLVDRKAILVHFTEEIGHYEGCPIGFESQIEVIDDWEFTMNGEDINLLAEYGIEGLWFRFAINPTEDEMIEFLEFRTMEYDEENLLDETLAEIEEMLSRYDFDGVLSYFDDVKVEWDVLIDDEPHFYRGGNDELMSY